jgi:hypothetical protein
MPTATPIAANSGYTCTEESPAISKPREREWEAGSHLRSNPAAGHRSERLLAPGGDGGGRGESEEESERLVWVGRIYRRVVASLGGSRRNDNFALLPCVCLYLIAHCFVYCWTSKQKSTRPWVLLSRATSFWAAVWWREIIAILVHIINGVQ